MKRRNPDAAADERRERLIDEELRAVFTASPVDLRARVLQAIDEGLGTRDEGRGMRAVGSGFSWIRQPRWAVAFAAAAVLVLAIVFVTWRASVKPEAERLATSRTPLPSIAFAAAVLVEPASEAPLQLVVAPAAQRARRALAWATDPLVADALPASGEPYLPGAPAGELGDPLQPMPSPPPIAFAPIVSAPPVSAFARPVTDFPADNRPPAAESGSAGSSGGTRR